MNPLLITAAPQSAIVPVGFDHVPLLGSHPERGRFPLTLARRSAASLVLGGRVAVIVGHHVTEAVLGRRLWHDNERYAWTRAMRRDEDGDIRVFRYALIPGQHPHVERLDRILHEALALADRLALA